MDQRHVSCKSEVVQLIATSIRVGSPLQRKSLLFLRGSEPVLQYFVTELLTSESGPKCKEICAALSELFAPRSAAEKSDAAFQLQLVSCALRLNLHLGLLRVLEEMDVYELKGAAGVCLSRVLLLSDLEAALQLGPMVSISIFLSFLMCLTHTPARLARHFAQLFSPCMVVASGFDTPEVAPRHSRSFGFSYHFVCSRASRIVGHPAWSVDTPLAFG